MDERNLLVNGRFGGDLASWTATGVSYVADDGARYVGCAEVQPGGALAQEISVVTPRRHVLHWAVRAPGGAGTLEVRLVDEQGRVVWAQESAVTDVWASTTAEVRLPEGVYTLEMANTGPAAVRVDEVWLWPVVLTRVEMAERVADRLGPLATEKGLSPTPAGGKTEGDYTFAVEEGLRAAGAVDPRTGEVDIRWLEAERVEAALAATERAMLGKLERLWAVEVDIALGPRRERLSQVREALAAMRDGLEAGAGGHGRTVQVRRMTYRTVDWEWTP